MKPEQNMKLYAWQPQGHGQKSFFVISESEEIAKKLVEKEISRLIALSQDDNYSGDECYSNYDFYGWGTDYYELTIASVGEVIINNND